jgi:hypothetical protein
MLITIHDFWLKIRNHILFRNQQQKFSVAIDSRKQAASLPRPPFPARHHAPDRSSLPVQARDHAMPAHRLSKLEIHDVITQKSSQQKFH